MGRQLRRRHDHDGPQADLHTVHGHLLIHGGGGSVGQGVGYHQLYHSGHTVSIGHTTKGETLNKMTLVIRKDCSS